MKKKSCYGIIIIISFVQIFVYTMAYLAIGKKLLEKRVYCDSQRVDGYLQSIWK